jgi:hypothetical protein
VFAPTSPVADELGLVALGLPPLSTPMIESMRPKVWFLLQSLIVFAVMASNIHWQWTPNTHLAGVLGFIAALLATVGLSNLLLWARQQSRQQSTKQRVRHRR